MENERIIKENITDFYHSILGYGYSDIHRAIEVALEVGEDSDWVADAVEQFSEETQTPLKDVDVVATVYDTILQEARGEIETETGFDFLNDGAEIYVAGNYMATSYDWGDDAPEKIMEVLKEHDIEVENLSEKTQWFLEQLQ
jgi:hypothetical protein